METIKDIVTEMRKDMPRVVDTKVILRNYANRIEQSVTNCNQLKMREALSDACYAMFNFLKTQNGGYEEMAKALDKAKTVLSAPARNCDLYTEAQLCEIITKEAQSGLSADTPQVLRDIVDIVAKGVIKGLFAEAKGDAK